MSTLLIEAAALCFGTLSFAATKSCQLSVGGGGDPGCEDP